MKTIQKAVEETIQQTPFIEEALHEKLINVSSLARLILPKVSEILKKDVKVGAVMMAINRLSPANELRVRKNISKLVDHLGDFIVRSSLCDFTYKNSSTLFKKIAKLMADSAEGNETFFTVSQGIFETNIVASKSLQKAIEKTLEEEVQINFIDHLASITIKLPTENMEQSGIYYFILKQLAWANIVVQEIISTTHEMTLIVKEEDVNESFAMLMQLKFT